MMKTITGFALAIMMAAGLMAAPQQARADETVEAKAFIQALTDSAITILANKDLSHDDKIAAFDILLTENVDMGRVARFGLGRYWRGVPEQTLEDYVELYRQYLVRSRADQLSAFSDEKINVTRALADRKSQFIVESEVVFSDGRPPASLDWRVRADKQGNLKVVDIIVENISMAITERDANVAMLANSNGSIEPLMAKLRKHVN